MKGSLGCIALCLLASACGTGETGGAGEPASIPRARLVWPLDGLIMKSADYDPTDRPLGYTRDGELLVAHQEWYSADDVVHGTCAGSGLYRLRRDGRIRPLAVGRPLCRSDEMDMDAAPDGRWAVYSMRMEPNNSGLVRMDVARERATRLRTGCKVYLKQPSISPDGRSIAAVGLCQGYEQESYALYTLRPNGSGLREIVPGDVGEVPAAWSPDGRWLAYENSPNSSDTLLSVGIVAADGTGARTLTPGTAPAWSPDGQWIALLDTVGTDRFAWGIYVIRPDGSGRRRVFRNTVTSTYRRGWGPRPEGEPAGSPVWSPDSRWIVFSRRFDKGTSIWRVEAATGRVEQVTRSGDAR